MGARVDPSNSFSGLVATESVREHFPSKEPDGLVNGMDESIVSFLDARSESYVSNASDDNLKRFHEGSQIDLRWVVLVSDDEHSFSFGNLQIQQLVTIPNRTHISAIGVQKVHRPVLSFLAVISKGPGDLDLDCPLAFYKQIWTSLGSDSAAVLLKGIQVGGNILYQLWLAEWPNSGLKVAKPSSRHVESDNRLANVSNDFL